MPVQKHDFNLPMAIDIIQNEMIDSQTWTEAAEWLLLFGPPEIRNVIRTASDTATLQCFPDLKPVGYTTEGEPCYDVKNLAQTLEISEEEALKKLQMQENSLGIKQIFNGSQTKKIQ